MATRKEIVATAREWLGTPFKHQGRIKGMACDCVGLPLMVLKELGIHDWCAEYTNYTALPKGRLVHEECQRRLVQKPIDHMQPGDVLTLKVPTEPCHVAIVTDLNGYLGIIHAYAGGKAQVVEHILDDKWRKRIEGCFSIPGVE